MTSYFFSTGLIVSEIEEFNIVMSIIEIICPN